MRAPSVVRRSITYGWQGGSRSDPECYRNEKKGAGRMGRGTERYRVQVTHSHQPDPAAVQRGLDLWAAYLAGRLGRAPAAACTEASDDGGARPGACQSV